MSLAHSLVPVAPATHDVVLDLLYATANNMTGRPIYAQPLCLLHSEAEVCLRQAVRLAQQAGVQIKIFDAFRPHEAQVLLWEAATDKAFVADPRIGSNHTRGVAIDLTLVDLQGQELDMGSGFDEMSELSHHFNPQVRPAAQTNRQLLLDIMQQAGFEPIAHEWWHYALPQAHAYGLVDSAALGALNPMLLPEPVELTLG